MSNTITITGEGSVSNTLTITGEPDNFTVSSGAVTVSTMIGDILVDTIEQKTEEEMLIFKGVTDE
jgi:hypothetical protein